MIVTLMPPASAKAWIGNPYIAHYQHPLCAIAYRHDTACHGFLRTPNPVAAVALIGGGGIGSLELLAGWQYAPFADGQLGQRDAPDAQAAHCDEFESHGGTHMA